MDKLAIGFVSDILYVKGVLSISEYEDIMEASSPSDLEVIIDKMLRGDYDALKRGELRSSFTPRG